MAWRRRTAAQTCCARGAAASLSWRGTAAPGTRGVSGSRLGTRAASAMMRGDRPRQRQTPLCLVLLVDPGGEWKIEII